MPFGQIDNPLGAFGYQTTAAQGQRQPTLHQQEIRVFRNVSPTPIVYGQWVTLLVDSTAPYGSSAGGTSGISGTTVDDCIYVTTIGGQRGVIGVALGAASSASTNATSAIVPRFNGPSSQYVAVVTKGPFYGALATSAAHAPGDIIVNSQTTVSGSVNFPQGGLGAAPTSANFGPLTTGAVTQRWTCGFFISTGTTVNSTLYGSSKTQRANVWVQPAAVVVVGTT